MRLYSLAGYTAFQPSTYWSSSSSCRTNFFVGKSCLWDQKNLLCHFLNVWPSQWEKRLVVWSM